MLLERIDYARPDTLDGALAALASAPNARPLAGGQSLVNALKLRAASVALLVDIGRLEELRGIHMASDGSISIGAATTYHELESSTELRAAQPAVAEVASHLVDRQVRSRGTIGGNCCYADPTNNFPPLLVALGARFTVVGPDGERSVAADDFFLGQFSTAVGRGELLQSIEVPALGAGTGVGYASLRLGEDSWALARAAAMVRGRERIEAARVVVACAGPRPARQREVERRLAGTPASGALEGALDAVGEELDPVSDVHASAAYRLEMARVMVRRAVQQAIAERRAA
jgi:carbon-monoxide dehydrogenase medium subunit